MESLRWLFEIQDRISGPAKTGARALRALRENLGAAERATDALNKAQRRAAGGGLSRSLRGTPFDRSALGRGADLTPKSLRGIQTAASGAGSAAGSMALRFGAVLFAVGAIASKLHDVFSIVTRIGGAVADLVQQFSRAVLEMAVFRERALTGLTMLTGSRGSARAVLNEARELSEFLGTDLRETIIGIQDLMVRGFSRRESTSIFQALADLSTISPTPVEVSRIVLAIGQIRNAGRLQGDELRQLQESGLPLDAVREAMARNLGVQTSELADLQKAGRISADVAIRSILEGIQARTGREIGGAAREFSQTLPGMLARLEQAPSRILYGLSEIVESDGGLSGLRDLLVSLVDLLDPASARGQAFLRVLATGFQVVVEGIRVAYELGRALFEGVFGAIDEDPVAALSGAVRSLLDWLVELRSPENIAWVRGLGRGLVALYGGLRPLLRGLAVLATIVGVVVVGITAFAAAALALPGVITALVVGGIALLIEGVRQLVEWLSGLAGSAVEWGRSIVMGLIGGMLSMLAPLRTTAETIGSTVSSAVTRVLGIHSPSREMERLGRMTGLGFQQGLDASMPTLSADGLGATPSSTVGRAGGVQLNGPLVGSIEVHGAGDPESTAAAIRSILLPELEHAFEQLAIQNGLA